MQGEFRMITDLATVAPKELLFNYDELKSYLSDELQAYRTLVVSENDIAGAKKDRAYLNKLAASLDEYRKLVKKILLGPYEEDFAPKVNELRAMTKEVSDHIDAQIKEIENAEKAERMAELRTYFDSSCKDVADYITWERIYNPKWETKSYGVSTAQDDIDRAIDTTRQNIEAVKSMHSPFETTLLLVLQETGDIVKVIQKKAACEALEAQRAEKEQERAQEAPQKAAESHEAVTRAETPPPAVNAESVEKTYVFTLEFEATKAQAFMIDDFFKANNIKYRKVR